MNKVTVTIDDRTVIFENVTRVKIDLSGDMFENKVYIYQGKKLTKIKEYQILDVDIK